MRLLVFCLAVGAFSLSYAKPSVGERSKFVRHVPVAGKSAGPISIVITYPREHPLKKKLQVIVEAWDSDSEATSMVMRLRSLDKKTSIRGAAKKSFSNTTRNQKRSHTFVVVANRRGDAYIAVDVTTMKGKKKVNRTTSFLIRGGGQIAERGPKKGKAITY